MAETLAPKTISLLSCDGERFEIAESVAVQSVKLRNMIDDGWSDYLIPLPGVTGEALTKVIEYLQEKKKKKDEEYLVGATLDELRGYLIAAIHLEIKGLVELVGEKIVYLLKEKPQVNVLRYFCEVLNGYSPEEEIRLLDAAGVFDH